MTAIRLLSLFSFFALFLLPSRVFAHGFGQSFFKEAGDYVLEFEYEALEVVDGDVNSYRFQLMEKDASGSGKTRSPLMVANNVGSFLEFDDVLVRFNEAESGDLVYAMRLVQDPLVDGLARLSAPLEKGNYKVKMSFYKDGEKLAEAVFDHKVLPKEKSFVDYWQYALIGLLLVLVVVLVVFNFKNRKPKKNEK